MFMTYNVNFVFPVSDAQGEDVITEEGETAVVMPILMTSDVGEFEVQTFLILQVHANTASTCGSRQLCGCFQ